MNYDELIDNINDIAGSDGFWTSSAEETFKEAAARLAQEDGFDCDEIFEFLSSLFSAVAGEYGE